MTNRKTFAAALAALTLCLACMGALVACGPAAETTDAAAQNRAYMSQANTAMMQLDSDLVPFSEAAAEGDVVTMEQVATAAHRDIESFKELSAPEAMVDIHAEYTAGCDDLDAALQAYVQLYREAESLEDSAFNERIAAIQEQYDSGIEHLQKGDQLVTELTGALPKESESSSSGE